MWRGKVLALTGPACAAAYAAINFTGIWLADLSVGPGDGTDSTIAAAWIWTSGIALVFGVLGTVLAAIDLSLLRGGAKALLFPISWPEPFGLVMIESMACGTPVIAFNSGSVPEIIEDGLTGFVVRDVEQASAAVGQLEHLFRPSIRLRFEERFSVRGMAQEYLRIYQKLTASDDVAAVAAE